MSKSKPRRGKARTWTGWLSRSTDGAFKGAYPNRATARVANHYWGHDVIRVRITEIRPRPRT
jgi:hypothetical protein